ncbi:MAG: hypothetical protein ACYCWW_14150, partial [Deltaproteobacteria bacterium]
CEPSCGAGESCLSGSCYHFNCGSVPCGPGQVCVQGSCAAAAWVGVACPAGQACVDGGCAIPGCDAGPCGPEIACASQTCGGETSRCGLSSDGGWGWQPSAGPVACDDGDSCTENDGCAPDGGCQGTPLACDTPPAGCFSAGGVCSAGACSYPPSPVGTACDGGGSCNGAGGCIPAGALCLPSANPCLGAGSATSDGGCTYPPLPQGTGCATASYCDGAGNCVQEPPCPAPPNPCLGAGTPLADGGCSYPPVGVGTTCSLPNAQGDCAGGACQIASCDPGYSNCDGIAANGCETPLGSSQNCAACGNACSAPGPDQTSACVSGGCQLTCAPGYASVDGFCGNFGGAFQQNVGGCSSTPCERSNPLDPGACGCPTGFAPSAPYATADDCAGVPPTPYVAANAYFCETDAAKATDVWAGAYQQDDPVSCGVGCRVTNPYTGGCSCPAGATDVAIRAILQTSCGVFGSRIHACLDSQATPSAFGGLYEVQDQGSCWAGNPLAPGGGCGCPQGFSPQSQLRTLVDPSAGVINGAVVFACYP